jgi:twinkle protein
MKLRIKSWEDIGIDTYKVQNPSKIHRCVCPSCKGRKPSVKEKDFWFNIEWGSGGCYHTGCELNEGVYVDESDYKKPPYTKLPDTIWDTYKSWGQERAKRGFSRADMDKMGVQPVNYFWADNKEATTALSYPFYDLDGTVANIGYRPPIKSLGFRFTSGCEMIFYNLNCLSKFKPTDKIPYIIITEGFDDCLSWIKAGFEYVLSVPNGVPVVNGKPTNVRLKYLYRNLELLKQAEVVYLATDDDLAGRVLRDELSRRIGREKCREVHYPKLGETPIKDTSDILKYGMATGTKTIDLIKLEEKDNGGVYFTRCPISGISDNNSDNERLFEALEEEDTEGCTLSFENEAMQTDDIITFKKQRVMCWAGMPNVAKTDNWMNAAVRLAVKYGWKFAVWSPETGSTWKVKKALAQIFTGKVIAKNVSFGQRINEEELKQATSFIDNHFIILDVKRFLSEENDKKHAFTLQEFLDVSKTLVEEFGVCCVVGDPFNNFEDAYARKYGQDSLSALNTDMLNCQIYVENYDCALWFVLHPSGTAMKNNKGIMKTFYDINFGAVFYNKCHVGVIIDRVFDTANTKPTREYGDEVSWRTEKVKERTDGKKGAATVNYHIPTGMIGSIALSRFVSPLEYLNGTEEIKVKPNAYEHWADRENVGDIIIPPTTDEECPF